MTRRRASRGVRRGESGVTLIELLVTIAIMAASFVALLSAFSTVEKQTASTTDDAQLVVLARQVTDVIEAQPAQQGIQYVVCSTASGATYQSELNADSAINKGTDTVTVVSVAQALGSVSSSWQTYTGSGTHVPLSSIGSCGTDYGVQQITFKVSSKEGNSLTRVVYKRWD